MSLKVSKPSDKMREKPKLSAFGKLIIGIFAVLAVVVAGLFIAANGTRSAKAEKEKNLLSAINRSIVVCQDSLTSLKADGRTLDALKEYKLKIEKEKDMLVKTDVALEMVGFALQNAQESQSVTDELNGTRNRIFVALKEYKK